MSIKTAPAFVFLFLSLLSGMEATATTKVASIKVMQLSGELLDNTRLTEQYKLQLQSVPNSLYIPANENEQAEWLIQPTIVFERGGMGVRALLTVSIKNLETGRWVAMKTFSDTQVFGSDNREEQTRDLLTKSVKFIETTFKPDVPPAGPGTSSTDDY